jgi:hypothetical protein
MTHTQYLARIRIYKTASKLRLLVCLAVLPSFAGLPRLFPKRPLGWGLELCLLVVLCVVTIVVLLAPRWIGILSGLRCPSCGKGLVTKDVEKGGKCCFCQYQVFSD